MTYGNLVISGTGTKTLAANAPIAGNLSVSSSTFDLGAFTANRTPAGGTLSLAGGATLRIGGATNVFPTGYTTAVTLDPASTVEYTGTGAQPGRGADLRQPHIERTPAAPRPRQGALIVAGNFLISSGIFNASTFTHRFAGNFTNSGTFTATSSTVILNGAAAQTITGATTFTNLDDQ